MKEMELLGHNRRKHTHGRCLATLVGGHVKNKHFPRYLFIYFLHRSIETLVADVG